MKYNLSAIRESQRLAYNLLASRFAGAMLGDEGAQLGSAWLANAKLKGHAISEALHPNLYYTLNKNYTHPTRIEEEAAIVQELPYTTADQVYTFNFANNGPQKSPTLNNVVIGKNDVIAIYALQILIGVGANAVNRYYRSSGLAASDNACYNSIVQMTLEDKVAIKYQNGLSFYEVPEGSPNAFNQYSGAVLLNPLRINNGELGTNEVTLTLNNSASALAFSPNLFLSCRLLCAYGKAKG